MNSRMRLVFSIGLLGLFCLMLPGSLRADAAGQQVLGYLYSGGTFITIGVPGATFTGVSGINDAGQIVGSYGTGDGEPLAFVDNGGVFTTISAPGATILSANGINDAGQIVGNQRVGDMFQGFVDSGGTFTTISVPGATGTSAANGINDAGEIVGTYAAGEGGAQGFVDNGGVFTTISVPGALATFANGINDAGQIVGNQRVGDMFQGFVDSGGTFTTISIPGALATVANGVNDAGQIVGTYGIEVIEDGKTQGFKTQGFVNNGGVFTTISVPGATFTYATGINDAGQIVGAYIPSVPEPGTLTLELAGIIIIAAAATLRLCAGSQPGKTFDSY